MLSWSFSRYLYYLESKTGISRINLGSNYHSEPIATTPTGGTALAMDLELNRLFICDGLGQITYMNLTGRGQDSYYSSLHNNRSCTALAVGGHMIYYSIPGDKG